MAVTAYKYAGTVADPLNGWTNEDYVKADDTSYATCAVPKSNPFTLNLTNFGFTSSDIPSGATIVGIEFVISRFADTADQVSDTNLYLQYNSADVGSNMASATKWPTSLADATYGGATNMCGTTLTQANILDSSFGIKIAPLAVEGGKVVSVDYIKIRVYYTESGGAGTNCLINIGDSWKTVDSMLINIGDVWKPVTEAKVNIGDIWKSIF